MNNSSFILIITLFLFINQSLSQDYNWTGYWRIWEAKPKYETARCCPPDSITITRNHDDNTFIDLYFDYIDYNPTCGYFQGTVLATEKIIAGRFSDNSPISMLNGLRGRFIPNNNTIVLDPGPLGDCTIVLGSNASIITNTTDTYGKLSWDGPWEINSFYKSTGLASCCLPLQPIVYYEDKKSYTITYTVFFPYQPECPPNLDGKALLVSGSIAGGSYVVPDLRITGYLLQNNSILINHMDCIYIMNKKDASIRKNSTTGFLEMAYEQSSI